MEVIVNLEHFLSINIHTKGSRAVVSGANQDTVSNVGLSVLPTDTSTHGQAEREPNL